MKLQILSDLHLEMLRNDGVAIDDGTMERFQLRKDMTGICPVDVIEETDADVIVLAGDISVGSMGVEWAAVESEIHQKPVIYVPGNHEYYAGEMTTALEAMRETAKGTGVSLLENEAIIIGGTRFLGATLWTDYSAAGDLSKHESMDKIAAVLADHRDQGPEPACMPQLLPRNAPVLSVQYPSRLTPPC